MASLLLSGGEGNSFFNRDLVRVDIVTLSLVTVALAADVGGVHFIRGLAATLRA